MKAVFQKELRSLARLFPHSEEIGLLRTGDIWTADGGPRVGEPKVMYSTDTEIDFHETDKVDAALAMVHAVSWNGQLCRA